MSPIQHGLLLASVLLGACAVGGQPYAPAAPPADQGVVYFYRPKGLVGGGVKPMLVDNGTHVRRIGNGQFLRHVVPPGRHRFHSDTMHIDQPATIEVEAGKTYYVKVFLKIGAVANTWQAMRVDPQQGEADLRECCRSGE